MTTFCFGLLVTNPTKNWNHFPVHVRTFVNGYAFAKARAEILYTFFLTSEHKSFWESFIALRPSSKSQTSRQYAFSVFAQNDYVMKEVSTPGGHDDADHFVGQEKCVCVWGSIVPTPTLKVLPMYSHSCNPFSMEKRMTIHTGHILDMKPLKN